MLSLYLVHESIYCNIHLWKVSASANLCVFVCAHINEFELAKAQSFKSFGIATVINYVQQTTKTFNNCLVIVSVAVPCLVSLYCLQLNHSYAVPFVYTFLSFCKYFSVIWPAHISISLQWIMPTVKASAAFGQFSILYKYWWHHNSLSLYEAFNQVNWLLLTEI